MTLLNALRGDEFAVIGKKVKKKQVGASAGHEAKANFLNSTKK